MKIQLNEQILNVKSSSIRNFNDYARSVGANVILTLGEPDFPTPEIIKDECKLALDNNMTKYGPTPGLIDLRTKICEFEKKLNNVTYTPDQVLITAGSTEAITASLFSMINPGDEVIIPMPAFPMYREIVEFARGKVVVINTTENHFQLSKEMLAKAITPKTKCIMFASPNNPTGAILNQDSLKNIYDAVKDKPIYVLCDDVYNQIIYDKKAPGFTQFQDIKEQIIVCQSFSKPYAMPGWRCGYLIADRAFIEQATKIHQYMIVGQNTFVQPAMKKALDFDPIEMVNSYKARRDYLYDRLVKMGMDVELPDGAFYMYPSIKKYGLTSLDFCKRLANEYKVALIPGSCFETDEFIRISYCVDMDSIKKACDALEKLIKTL